MINVDTIDWNEAWKAIDRHKREKDGVANYTGRWLDYKRCGRFNRRVQEDNWKQAWERVHAMKVEPSSRVLDIGAGPGTLAIPLAGTVRHVTAVEPSPAMLGYLHENMGKRGITNVSTIQKKWEDVDLNGDLDAPYDIVVASYSLGVPDLREALERMDRVSSRYVYIFWFAGTMSPRLQYYRGIWEDLFGTLPYPRHTLTIIYNLLHQMGIYANVEITKADRSTRFSSVDEAVSDQQYELDLKDERQVAVLRDYLEKTLEPENGSYVLRRRSHKAKIWWEKEV